jgi:hypothetical protein
MTLQIGRFSFRGPFKNLDEIRNRPGLFIIHRNIEDIEPIVIKETALLHDTIEKELLEMGLELGDNYYISVYNTFCALAIDRAEMIEEIKAQMKVKT